MRRKLDSGVGTCQTTIEANLERRWREMGFRVYKPDYPRFLLVRGNEIIFAEGLRLGERFSRSKKVTMTLLARLGFNVEVLSQTRRDKWDIQMAEEKLLEMITTREERRGVIYDPDKHRMTSEQKQQMIDDEKRQRERDEEFLSMFTPPRELTEKEKMKLFGTAEMPTEPREETIEEEWKEMGKEMEDENKNERF
jgi:hypothetical protein